MHDPSTFTVSPDDLGELANALPAFLAILDRSCRYRYANEHYHTKLGLTPDQVVGSHVRDLHGHETWSVVRPYMARCLEGQCTHFEKRVSLGSGSSHYVHASFTPRYSNSGAVVGIYVCVLDRTEQHDIEQRVQQTQKLESLGVLAGGIAHDFNNMLVAILGNAAVALEAYAVPEGLEEELRDIESSARRASELCNQLLRYSGASPVRKESIDMGALLAETLGLLRTAASKNIILRTSLPSALPPVDGDPSQIQQVLMNLVTNASDAIGSEPGEIRVQIGTRHCTREDLLRDNLSQALEFAEGEYVFVEVEDTGCGMDEQTRVRIFDPFFSTKFAGRGLGLASVLGIVNSHEGALTLATTPGSGTTFTLLLPVSPASAPDPDCPPPRRSSWTSDATVLLVDDDPVVRRTVTRMLASFGLQVLVAEDGADAVAAFERERDTVDCVLLDLTMPGMDGKTALSRMQELKPGTPILVASGFHEASAESLLGSAGVVGFLQKPFGLEALMDGLKLALEPAS